VILLGLKLEEDPPFRIFEEEFLDIEIKENNQSLRDNLFDKGSLLWGRVDLEEWVNLRKYGGRYIDSKIEFAHRQQVGPTCLSTCLAILITGLTGGRKTFTDKEIIEEIRLKVNTGAPRTWSECLHRNTDGFRLAYCNTDHRRLSSYITELKRHDDLFLVSWYGGNSKNNFDPDKDGSIGGSHVVIWWKNQIIDTAKEHSPMAFDEYFKTYGKDESAVKRIFRIVAPWSIHRL